MIVAIGTNGLTPVGRTEHRSDGASRPAWRLEGRHPMLSVTGIGLGNGAASKIAHLSAWNTRHSMLAGA